MGGAERFSVGDRVRVLADAPEFAGLTGAIASPSNVFVLARTAFNGLDSSKATLPYRDEESSRFWYVLFDGAAAGGTVDAEETVAAEIDETFLVAL